MLPYVANKDFYELCRHILLAAICCYVAENRTRVNVSCQLIMNQKLCDCLHLAFTAQQHDFLNK